MKTCAKCGNQFSAKSCPCLRRSQNRESQKRFRKKLVKPGNAPAKYRADSTDANMRGVLLRTHEEVAAIIGVRNKSTVMRLEQNALKKIRNHADLRALWTQCRDVGNWHQEDETERLLEMQLEVQEFYSTHDALITEGQNDAAVNCLLGIADCQKALQKALEVYQ